MDLSKYNAAQPWNIDKILNFGYSGYKTGLLIFTIICIFAGLFLAGLLAFSGENAGRQRLAITGIVGIVIALAVAYFAPWLISVVSEAASTASQ
ncbi:MAG: hypothetical protein ACREHC_01515 [Candidatus Levyibacteriota bacterium]